MRVALFANPGSGSGDAERVADLLEQRGAGVETLEFKSACDGEDDVVERVRRADRLVAAGGDGSLGPAAALALAAGIPLAVVPTGTANSLARFLDIPLDVEEAVALAVDPDARTRPLEVAHADGRPFLNAATGAFGGDSGTGGVDPADERLDVAVVEAGPRRRLVRRAWAMRRQRLVDDDEVVHVRGAEIEVDLPPGSEVNVDGEILALDRARFGVLGRTEVVVG